MAAPTADARVWVFNGVKFSRAEDCAAAVLDAQQRAGKAPYWSKLAVELVENEVRIVCNHCGLVLFILTNPTVSLSLVEDQHLKKAFAILGVHKLPSRKALSTTHIDRVYEEHRSNLFQQQFGDSVVVRPGAPEPQDDPFGLGELPVVSVPFSVSSDGWKKKAAGHGVPLINFTVQPCTGSARPIFVKVRGAAQHLALAAAGAEWLLALAAAVLAAGCWLLPSAAECCNAMTLMQPHVPLPSALQAITAAGVTKDAEWIKDLHVAFIKALSGGNMHLCRGVHMDNTKANRKAMMLMEEKFTWMVNLGCAGHGLSLSIKDLGNVGKLQTTVGKVLLETCKMMSNAIGDSEKLRALVQSQQRLLYGKVSWLGGGVHSQALPMACRLMQRCDVAAALASRATALPALCTHTSPLPPPAPADQGLHLPLPHPLRHPGADR